MPTKYPKVSCDMIVVREGKVLMGKRGDIFGKGSWALPGGHLEFNEKTEDCCRRELMEEIGITPTKISLLGIFNDIADLPGQENHYIRFIYLITEFSGVLENKEPDRCEGWEWVDVHNLPEPLFVGSIKILEYYKDKDRKFFND